MTKSAVHLSPSPSPSRMSRRDFGAGLAALIATGAAGAAGAAGLRRGLAARIATGAAGGAVSAFRIVKYITFGGEQRIHTGLNYSTDFFRCRVKFFGKPSGVNGRSLFVSSAGDAPAYGLTPQLTKSGTVWFAFPPETYAPYPASRVSGVVGAFTDYETSCKVGEYCRFWVNGTETTAATAPTKLWQEMEIILGCGKNYSSFISYINDFNLAEIEIQTSEDGPSNLLKAAVRNADEKPGLLNVTTGEFYTNAGSGADFTWSEADA